MGGRHHFRIPLGPEGQNSRRLGRSIWSMACALWDPLKWGLQKHPANGHEQKHDESTFGNKTTTDTSVTELTFREMHPCFRRHVSRVYISDIQIWTYTVLMVHACACPIYTYCTYTHISNHFILMKCLRILMCQKKKKFLCIS